MLRAISIALRVIAAISLLCAMVIRFRHVRAEAGAHSNQGPIRFADWVTAVHADDWGLPVRDEETMRKSFTLTGDGRSLELDNISGFIDVVGTDGDQVQLVVNKKLRAESKEKLEEARKEIMLEIRQDGNSLRVYVGDPWHWRDERFGFFGLPFGGFPDDRGYCGSMDFEVQVPQDIRLMLRTVSGGMRVRNVNGDFSVHSVSGSIAMDHVAGSGTAHTVSGAVRVKFHENPRRSSDFGSINGSVELSFAPNLNADFRLHTFNGSIDSDFAMTPSSPTIEHQGLKTIYRARQADGGRVGAGGPEIRVETMNGAIRLLENHE